jgi:esterase/lipase
VFGVAWHTVVLVFGLIAFAPVRFGDLASHPHAAADYQASVVRIARLQTREDSVVAAGGRSILLTHGHRSTRAVILFHGLTDSPLQFLPFAQQLYESGDNVFVPRIPHHAERAGNMKTMGRLTAQELRDLGDGAVDVAQGLGDTLVVAGLSLGGTVAAWTGQYRPEVQRVVLIAPALAPSRVPRRLEGTVVRIALRAPNVRRSEPRDSTEPDRLPGWATHAVAQTFILGDVVRAAAGSRAPQARDVVLLLSASDRTISNGAALDLARRWSEHGANVRAYEFSDTLRLPHDVVDPRHPGSDTAAVYPVLAALIAGQQPPAWAIDVSASIRPLRRPLAVAIAR